MDALYVQLAGRSSHLLFAADVGLLAYPADHPYADHSISSIRTAGGFAAEAEMLRGKGGVAELRAGDALFVPNHWWRQVQSRRPADVRAAARAATGEAACCISLGLHFHNADAVKLASQAAYLMRTSTPAPGSAAPSSLRRLPAHVHAQLARAAEALLEHDGPTAATCASQPAPSTEAPVHATPADRRIEILIDNCTKLLEGLR